MPRPRPKAALPHAIAPYGFQQIEGLGRSCLESLGHSPAHDEVHFDLDLDLSATYQQPGFTCRRRWRVRLEPTPSSTDHLNPRG
jgi:hypothetical protein